MTKNRTTTFINVKQGPSHALNTLQDNCPLGQSWEHIICGSLLRRIKNTPILFVHVTYFSSGYNPPYQTIVFQKLSSLSPRLSPALWYMWMKFLVPFIFTLEQNTQNFDSTTSSNIYLWMTLNLHGSFISRWQTF